MGLITWIVALWIIVAIGVGIDAENNGKSGFEWFTIVLLTGIFGALYYVAKLPSRKEEELEQRVLELESNADYCPQCGTKLTPKGCPSCGDQQRPIEEGGKEINDQGKSLEESSSPHSWVSPQDIDGQGTSFGKTVGYATVGLFSLFVGVVLWYGIASKLVPFKGLPPNESIQNLHRHIKDMGTGLTFSLTLVGLLIFRSVSDYHIVTETEQQWVALVQSLVLFYMFWKVTVLATLFQTLPQIFTSLTMLLTTAAITFWSIRNSGLWTSQRFTELAT